MQRKTILAVADILRALGYEAEHISKAIKILQGNANAEHQPLLTAKQVCQILAISRTTLWRLKLPSIQVGSGRRYDLQRVLTSLAEKQPKASTFNNWDEQSSHTSRRYSK